MCTVHTVHVHSAFRVCIAAGGLMAVVTLCLSPVYGLPFAVDTNQLDNRNMLITVYIIINSFSLAMEITLKEVQKCKYYMH